MMLARRPSMRLRVRRGPTARDAFRRIREHLETEAVLRAAVAEVHRPLASSWTSVWLTDGKDRPRLAYASGTPGNDEATTDLVLRCARRHRTVGATETDASASRLAVPVSTARSGLLAVLYVERRRQRGAASFSADDRAYVESVADEAGYAIETSRLYQVAVAEKEKSLAILARVGDGVVVTDASGRICEANQAASSVLDCPAGEAIGRRCTDLLGLHVGERELDCSKGCALLDEDAREAWRLRHDGRRQPLLVNVATVRDGGGNVTDVVHSFRDITRLKEADEAKTMFLATASHELKTPLTVIQGFAQTLRTRRDAVDVERALLAIEQRSLQLNKIVDRLLLSSRIDAGRIQVNLCELDVGPILAERVEALAAASGRTVGLEAPPGALSVIGDVDAITTVIDHLLDNAVKFSPEGGSVVVSVAVEEDTVGVHVTDGGVGMDAEQAIHCFDRFWQAESSDVRRFGGTGIGLYIVRSLVEAMGGRVCVKSRAGGGSTFSFTLGRPGAAPAVPETAVARDGCEPSTIREFMKQVGLPG